MGTGSACHEERDNTVGQRDPVDDQLFHNHSRRDGVDRIGGPSVFTRDRFEGIKIEATGQNIITLGDGNQVNAKFEALGESLADLRKAIKESNKLSEPEKVDLVVDVDTLQTQLGRTTPNDELISRLWEGINRAASLAGLAEVATKVGALLSGLS